MKISIKNLKKLIKENIFDENLNEMVTNPFVTAFAYNTGKEIVEKGLKDFLIGVPVETIFANWKNNQKENIIEDILGDKGCTLKFDGYHLHWLGSDKSTKFKLQAGSGYEMFKNDQFLSPASKKDPRSKMHNKGTGPAPEGLYTVLEPQSATGELRDVNSILGECAFWLGTALKQLGYGKSYAAAWSKVDWSPMVKTTWGNFRCATRMENVDNPSNRSGIFVHGGTDQSSAGCIDLATDTVDNMNIFGPLYVMWYAAHGNIPMVVDYSIHY